TRSKRDWSSDVCSSDLAHGTAVEATAASFAVIAISIAVDFFRARVLSRTAAETSSQALEADALHFSSDMWSSLAVLVGLCAVARSEERRVGQGWSCGWA